MGRPPLFFGPNCGARARTVKYFPECLDIPSLSLHACRWALLIPLPPHGLQKFLKQASILASGSLFPTSSERKVKNYLFATLDMNQNNNSAHTIFFNLLFIERQGLH